MLCAIARIDAQARKQLVALQHVTERFGITLNELYGHITIATYIGDDAEAFIASCKKIISAYSPFSIYYEKVEVLGATSIIVATPRNEKVLFDLHHAIATQWGPYLDRWTNKESWQPHTTLVYNPQIDLHVIAEDMRRNFIPFSAQVTKIEFSMVTENDYIIIDSIDMLQRKI